MKPGKYDTVKNWDNIRRSLPWRKLEPWIAVLIVLAILAAWELMARAERISPLFFPPPTQILDTFKELVANGKLLEHLAATLIRLALGFLLGCIPGFLLGLMMGWSPRVRGA